MRHLLPSICMALLVAVPALRADEKKGRADELKAIQDDFLKAQQEYTQAVRNAKTDEERQEARKKMPQIALYVNRAQKLVDADAKDAVALDALLFIVQRSPLTSVKALNVLAEHHAASPKVVSLCTIAARTNATKFLEAVLEKNSDAKAKGLACYSLGNALHGQAERNAAEAGALNKKAEDYLERAEKEFGEVVLYPATPKRPAITIGNQAKRVLYEIRNLAIGKTAPEVVSHNLDDKQVKLADLRGKVVVLDFWATWCPPCRAMIPHSRELVEKMKDKPFVLVSISSDEKKETLTEFLEKEQMPWTHWWEGTKPNSLHNVWNIQGIPTVYIIDAKGVIRYKQVGFLASQADRIDKEVEKLLEEGQKK